MNTALTQHGSVALGLESERGETLDISDLIVAGALLDHYVEVAWRPGVDLRA